MLLYTVFTFSFLLSTLYLYGADSGAVGWGTALQAGRSRVWFLMVSGASTTSWNPQGLPRPVMRLLYILPCTSSQLHCSPFEPTFLLLLTSVHDPESLASVSCISFSFMAYSAIWETLAADYSTAVIVMYHTTWSHILPATMRISHLTTL